MTLRPYPLGALVRRAFVEREREDSIFGLPARRWFKGVPQLDLSIVLHGGTRVATPVGPAAGPHTQLAHNIVLSWLAGARAIELKTVQVRDDLAIARPCIDMRTTGFNVEWSQELTLRESLEEYVKASMLLRILTAGGVLPDAAGGSDFVFELSVGYDLAGIRSDAMTRFLRGMLDARPIIERLRTEIPDEWASYRDLDFPTTVSRSVTLSTFHGCPPSEVEAIVSYLQRTFGVHCTVKFNPTLLGVTRVSEALTALGYRNLRVPQSAFANDLRWSQAVDLVERCGTSARALGVGFGVKCSNTLVVENDGDFLPSTETHRYLSGRPLHLLAMEMVRDFRGVFGNRYPISFSAGVERWNVADVVALGLRPVTVCTDLLRESGYARMAAYFTALTTRMREAGACNLEELVRRQAGGTDDASILGATSEYVDGLTSRRELKAATVRPPRKIDSQLALFDCLACDKCLPVCPNHALFTFVVPTGLIAAGTATLREGQWSVARRDAALTRRHQIGVFADFCNECGNCDVFCPEHGGPHKTKPRFFGSHEAWAASAYDGWWVSRRDGCVRILARLRGQEYCAEEVGELLHVRGDRTDVLFHPADPCGTLQVLPATSVSEIDLAPFAQMHALARAVLDPGRINYINVLTESATMRQAPEHGCSREP